MGIPYGRLVKSSAERYPEAFQDFYDNARGDKDRIASLTIGLNPENKPLFLPLDATRTSFKTSRTVLPVHGQGRGWRNL